MTDMGQYDAMKPTPTSPEQQKPVFDRHMERVRQAQAWLDLANRLPTDAEILASITQERRRGMIHDTLLLAQMAAYPDSIVLTDDQMLGLLYHARPKWEKQALTDVFRQKSSYWKLQCDLERECSYWARSAFMCRSSYPDGFFYACGKQDDGYRFVGFRYGREESEYMSGWEGLEYKPQMEI